MKAMKISLLYAFVLLSLTSCDSLDEINILQIPERGFYSEKPAVYWTESLLSGNGTMGVMVMGSPYRDTVITNHALLYLPINEPLLPVSQGEHLDKIRQMMLDGKYGEASQYIVDLSQKEGYKEKRWTDPYIPALDLVVNSASPGKQIAYARTVNFETGVVDVKWSDETANFSREVFVSRPDSVIVMRYRSDKPGSIHATFNLSQRISTPDWWGPGDRAIESISVKSESNYIVGNTTFVNKWENLIRGYDEVAKVINVGGEQHSSTDGIAVKGADEVLVLLKISPVWDEKARSSNQLKEYLDKIPPGYNKLLKRHAKIHGELFNRSSLNLNGDSLDRKLSSEKLIEKSRGTFNGALIERSYDAARYHAISAIGTNPPNLQGIWGGTMYPAWSADYTTNGNLPVAISSLLSSNMPELMLPVFNYLEKHLPEFRVNAQRLFNCRGIHVPSRLSSHGYNNHFDAVWPMTFWTMGAAWYSMYYYDYYLYTQDEAFLKNRALPFMHESILFYEDFLTVGKDGKYVFNPSYSPENNPANIPSQACINATMEVMAVKQLLRNVIAASQKVGANQDKTAKWEDMLSKMPAYEVNKHGELREWIWPGVEENHEHRHVSHLYGLFDMIDPAIASDTVLLNGARRVVDERMKIRRRDKGGIMVFGMAHLAHAAAALGESGQLYDMLKWFSSQYWTCNMFTTHDPGYLFNFDLTGGYPAVIIKMLAYSEPGKLSLFRAKPEEIAVGSIKGILLRGGIKLEELSWDNKKVEVAVSSSINQVLKIDFPQNILSASAKGSGLKKSDSSNVLLLSLPVNKLVNLSIELE